MITSLSIFADYDCIARLTCPDGTKVEITLVNESLKDMTIEQRFAKLMEKGNNYIAANCQQP